MSSLRLRIEGGGGPGREVVLGALGGMGLVVGRAPDAGLVLEDPSLSRHHCRLRASGTGVAIEDVGSRAGTRVNGVALVAAHRLRVGDRVELGDLRLEVLSVGEASDAPAVAPETLAPAEGPETMRSAPGRSGGVSQAAPALGLDVDLHGHDRVVLGRSSAEVAPVDNPLVSRRHAELTRLVDGWLVRDLNSTNGTFVNGVSAREPQRFGAGDVLRLGPVRLSLVGSRLSSAPPAAGTRLVVRGLTREVAGHGGGAPHALVRDVDLTVEPRSFVAVVGASGSGKSTLVEMLAGRERATRGRVLVDGRDLERERAAITLGIGYVPQELVLHDALPLEDALRHAGRLRLPDDTTPDELEAGIDRVLATVGLPLQRLTPVRLLSGGQKKRAAIAIELLSRPSLLFLDEATSGLDAGTEAQMMGLFRELADGGLSVVCVTHHVESLGRCDRVVWLTGGRLAYYGPPDELLRHVGAPTTRAIYEREAERSPQGWEARYRASPDYAQYVGGAAPDGVAPLEGPAPAAPTPPRRSPWRQARVLATRYAALLTADRRALKLSLLLPPLLGLLVGWVLGGAASESAQELARRQGQLAFVTTLIAFFLGIFGAIREVVKERAIVRHESFLGVGVAAYFASKALPLAGLGLLQTTALALGVHLLAGPQVPFAPHVALLAATHLAATFLGLLLSALVDSAEKAVTSMILVVVPQLLLANAFIELRGATRSLAAVLVVCHAAYDGVKSLLPADLLATPGPNGRPLLLEHRGALPGLLGVLAFATLYAALTLWALARAGRSPRRRP